MSENLSIKLKIRRFDYQANPEIIQKVLNISPNTTYAILKKEIYTFLELSEHDQNYKVIKIRNSDLVLVPMMTILNPTDKDHRESFYIDVANMNSPVSSNANLLQDAYLDALRQKLQTMESRVNHAEQLVPELQWIQQSHMDSTINILSSRVQFLDKRFDDLMPTEWKNKIPQTIS